GRTVIVNIGTITPDEQITITIRTRVNERAQPPGGRNVATLTTSSLANDPSNDTSEVTFRIVVDLTPTPTATLPVSPTLALPTPGTATPVVPSTLPKTGAEESSAGFVLLIAALGLVGFALSLLLRRGARK
ncbi:MAG TPA: LPXTG cell wall anchor domain-containing protein, partial [Roseiflexaceae bacterium]